MRAWHYTDASAGLERSLHLVEAPKPFPQLLSKSELLIQVLSMSLNPSDYKIPELGLASKLFLGTPAAPGADFCGKVVATHGANDRFTMGQTVFGRLAKRTKNGTLSEFVVASQNGVVALRPEVSVDDAAAVGTAALTAYQSIVPFVKGLENPAIFINGGSGGVGTWAIQIAMVLGAEVSVSCSGSSEELVRELGAEHVLDYTKVDIIEGLKNVGPVFDLFVDNVGTPTNLYQESEHFLKPNGRYVQVGAPVKLSSGAQVIDKMLRPTWMGGGKRAYSFVAMKTKQDDLAQLASWQAEGKIKAVIDEVFEYEDVPKAIEKLKTGHVKGKLVIHVSKGP
jgi:NADPH:quinone reductase-like Zn-dependent oxidoreductase